MSGRFPSRPYSQASCRGRNKKKETNGSCTVDLPVRNCSSGNPAPQPGRHPQGPIIPATGPGDTGPGRTQESPSPSLCLGEKKGEKERGERRGHGNPVQQSGRWPQGPALHTTGPGATGPGGNNENGIRPYCFLHEIVVVKYSLQNSNSDDQLSFRRPQLVRCPARRERPSSVVRVAEVLARFVEENVMHVPTLSWSMVTGKQSPPRGGRSRQPLGAGAARPATPRNKSRARRQACVLEDVETSARLSRTCGCRPCSARCSDAGPALYCVGVGMYRFNSVVIRIVQMPALLSKVFSSVQFNDFDV
ncbi:unnamed protein product [Diatraea saccharalis]|uniref:Uncharacterized protein n=1 Tax=Diatraea saccharalis TaxID=40085 RepID=A0A9N9R175_9NEOP|nr:unnamed protein product [Diatraea saccharalis]